MQDPACSSLRIILSRMMKCWIIRFVGLAGASIRNHNAGGTSDAPGDSIIFLTKADDSVIL